MKSVQKYEITLNSDQRKTLIDLTGKGKESVRKIKRANILLLADERKKDEEIAEIVRISRSTVERIRKRFATEGLEESLNEKQRPGKPIKIDGRVEADIIKIACSEAPDGRAKWTLRLLADRIDLDISHVAVYNTLKKTKLNRG